VNQSDFLPVRGMFMRTVFACLCKHASHVYANITRDLNVSVNMNNVAHVYANITRDLNVSVNMNNVVVNS